MTAPETGHGSGSLFVREPVELDDAEPVTCLGITFESDDARRQYFLERLREKLPELRKRADFPHGEDGDILRMSDPPYYTACPNPFLPDFVAHHGRPYDPEDEYHREPYAVDVRVGKTDKLYRAHSYHTKVPHLAIVPSILHYTRPGDVVLDGFCGSGMTGVAAQWCGTAPQPYRKKLEVQWKQDGRDAPEWGARQVILGDLSPAATFIAANYNIPFDVHGFVAAGRRLLDDLEQELGWMYETLDADGVTKGRINYTVWSEVFGCSTCGGETVFLEAALDAKSGQIARQIKCRHCGAEAPKEQMDLLFETFWDASHGRMERRPRRTPLLVNYSVPGHGRPRAAEKPIGAQDIKLLGRIEALGAPDRLPSARLPDSQMRRVGRVTTTNTRCLSHFFLARPGHALAALWRRADKLSDPRMRSIMLFFVEQAIWGMSTLARYAPTHYSQVNRYLSGVFYVSSQIAEVSPWYILEGKLRRLKSAFHPLPSAPGRAVVSTSTCGDLNLANDTIDYIFTDPPFGENIYYSDLNLLVESWHGVITRNEPEAIVDRVRKKTILDYQNAMTTCFTEYNRVLKPGRWMTVVFHNSKNAVWHSIQEAMSRAGFVVADVRTLDKKQKTFKQGTSASVKQDLVISAYKPSRAVSQAFRVEDGSERTAWTFVSAHLQQVPVFVAQDGVAEAVVERQRELLYDRMVAFHVQRSIAVPLSVAEFHAGLVQRYAERDDMYFLPEQVVSYDRKRMLASGFRQPDLFVHDEDTAIQWLRRALASRPRSFQDLHSAFVRELAGWEKSEEMLELKALLRENFLHYDGMGEVPSQIHSYLSSNFKELRNLPKHDVALRGKGKDRWYVPDPRKAKDLEKLRERGLLREFDEYRKTGKRLRRFRSEAVRAGFRKAWQEGDYETIVSVAERMPDDVLHNDPKLLMWYDQAVTRMERDSS